MLWFSPFFFNIDVLFHLHRFTIGIFFTDHVYWQASLLSMLPVELLKISDVSKLTANLLSPIVKWVWTIECKQYTILDNNALINGMDNYSFSVLCMISIMLCFFTA